MFPQDDQMDGLPYSAQLLMRLGIAKDEEGAFLITAVVACISIAVAIYICASLIFPRNHLKRVLNEVPTQNSQAR